MQEEIVQNEENNNKKNVKKRYYIDIKDKYMRSFYLFLGFSINLFVILFLYLIFLVGGGEKPFDMRVTNIDSTSATLTWITKGLEYSAVAYNSTGEWKLVFNDSYANLALDDRDMDYDSSRGYLVKRIDKYFVHHVTLRNLEPDTKYSIRLMYGPKMLHKYDYPEFKTASGSIEVSNPVKISGSLVVGGAYGSVSDALVIATVVDYKTGDKSSPVSTIVNDDGTYSFDISKVRSADLEKVIEYHPLNKVEIEAFSTDNIGRGELTDFASNLKSAKPILMMNDDTIYAMTKAIKTNYAYNPNQSSLVLGEGDSVVCDSETFVKKVTSTSEYRCNTRDGEGIYLRVNIQKVRDCVNNKIVEYTQDGEVVGACLGDEPNLTDADREILKSQNPALKPTKDYLSDKQCFGHRFVIDENGSPVEGQLPINFSSSRVLDGRVCTVDTTVDPRCAWSQRIKCPDIDEYEVTSEDADVVFDIADVLPYRRGVNFDKLKFQDLVLRMDCPVEDGYSFIPYPKDSIYDGYGYCYIKNPSLGNKCDPSGSKDDCPSDKVCTLNSSEKGGIWECMDRVDPELGAIKCDPFKVDPCSGGKICVGIGTIDEIVGDQYLCVNDPSMEGQDQPLRVRSEDELFETLETVSSGSILGLDQVRESVAEVSNNKISYPLGIVPTNLLTIKNTVCKNDSESSGALCLALNKVLENEKLNTKGAVEEDELELWDQLCFVENGKVKNRVDSLDTLVGDLPLGITALLRGIVGEDGIAEWCEDNNPDLPTSLNRNLLKNKSRANSAYRYDFNSLYDSEGKVLGESDEILPFKVENGEVVLANSGLQSIDFIGQSIVAPKLDIKESGARIKFYYDLNANGFKDELEPWVMADELTIDVVAETQLRKYELEEGWNMIGFPIIVSENLMAQDVFEKFGAQGIYLTDVAVYRGGRWMVYSYNPDKQKYYGNNYEISQAEGLFVRSSIGGSAVLEGKVFGSGVPMYLTNGWNLISVAGTQELYSGFSLLDSIRKSQIEATKLVKYQGGRFQTVLIRNGIPYGIDNIERIVDQEGYLVFVEKGSGVFRP